MHIRAPAKGWPRIRAAPPPASRSRCAPSNASAIASAGSAPPSGDLAEDSGADLVAGASLLATAEDGKIPWRGRPDSLKRGLVARIPPLTLLKDQS
jgi:predicted metal-binding protein